MPLKIWVSGKETFINPKTVYNTIKLETENAVIKVDPGFYVATLNITGK
jgi:hypothetical protein